MLLQSTEGPMPINTLRQLLDPTIGMDVSAFTEPLRLFLGAYTEQRGQRLYVDSPFYSMLLRVRGGWLLLRLWCFTSWMDLSCMCGGAIRTVAVSRCTLHSCTVKALCGRSRAHPLGESAALGMLVSACDLVDASLHAPPTPPRQWWTTRGA